MARRVNPELKDGAVYRSQKKASAKYEAKNPSDKIIIRVPAGSRDKINAYVERMAEQHPDNPKYATDKGRPSVNALIKTLLEEEMGESLD